MKNKLAASALFGLVTGVLLMPAPAHANPELTAKLAAGVWRSLVVGGTNVHDYPLTQSGRRHFEGFRLDLDPSLTCEPPGMPRAFYHLSPMDFSFDGSTVTIRYETMDVVRTDRTTASLKFSQVRLR